MIAVVADGPSTVLAAALRGAGLPVRTWSPTQAATPGLVVGAQQVVLGFAPGTHPLFENEAFQHATLIYAHGDDAAGTIGPLTARGIAPCPVCLSAPEPGRSFDGAPLRWVAASLVLELATLRTRGVSTLLGTSITWSLGEEPGLTSDSSYHRRGACRTPGCVDARS